MIWEQIILNLRCRAAITSRKYWEGEEQNHWQRSTNHCLNASREDKGCSKEHLMLEVATVLTSHLFYVIVWQPTRDK